MEKSGFEKAGQDFVSKYVEYASGVTDSPLDFHQLLAIATVGSVLGRSRYIQFGEFRIYPNFWMIILAPTAFYRKSTALMIAQRILSSCRPGTIYPTEFSHEKIQAILQQNPQGTFYYYEFRTLMGLLSRDYMAGTKSMLTELFDNPDTYSRSTLGSNICITDPCISLISATTCDWFLSSIRQGDIEGGFLNRFAYVFSDHKLKDQAIPPHADPVKRATVYKMLAETYEYNKNLDWEMELTEDSRKMYEHFYSKFINMFEDINPQYRNLFVRLNIYCLKIAIILQVCYKGDESHIHSYAMKEAIQITSYLTNSLKVLCEGEMSFSLYDKQEKQVTRVLREKKELTRTELLKYSHLDSRTFNNVFQTLTEKGMIEVEEKRIGDSPKITTFIKIK